MLFYIRSRWRREQCIHHTRSSSIPQSLTSIHQSLSNPLGENAFLSRRRQYLRVRAVRDGGSGRSHLARVRNRSCRLLVFQASRVVFVYARRRRAECFCPFSPSNDIALTLTSGSDGVRRPRLFHDPPHRRVSFPGRLPHGHIRLHPPSLPSRERDLTMAAPHPPSWPQPAT
jgi:hypothetical protein